MLMDCLVFGGRARAGRVGWRADTIRLPAVLLLVPLDRRRLIDGIVCRWVMVMGWGGGRRGGRGVLYHPTSSAFPSDQRKVSHERNWNSSAAPSSISEWSPHKARRPSYSDGSRMVVSCLSSYVERTARERVYRWYDSPPCVGGSRIGGKRQLTIRQVSSEHEAGGTDQTVQDLLQIRCRPLLWRGRCDRSRLHDQLNDM